MRSIGVLLGLVLVVSGCTFLGIGEEEKGSPPSIVTWIPDRVAERARATLVSIDQSSMTPEEKAAASECPQSVVGLDDLRQQLKSEGGSGLIWDRQQMFDQVKASMRRVVDLCNSDVVSGLLVQ